MAGAKAKVLVLGAGFGGLYTALLAHRALGRRAQVAVVDRNEYFLFTPLLYQIVTGALAPRHIARPLARLVPRGVRLVQAEVRAVDLPGRRVETEGGPFPYDFLVIALGAVTNFYGLRSAEEHALPFRTVADALHLRAHLERRFGEAQADPHMAQDHLRVVVAGAGCTGVELITELHDWMRGPLRRRFPGVPASAVSLILAEALDHLLCPIDPTLMRAAVRSLVERDIDIRFGHIVNNVAPDRARAQTTAGEVEIVTRTVVWTAGIKGHPLLAGLPIGYGPGGRIRVSATLQVPEYPEVLVVGDAAACPDQGSGLVPVTAQVAVQQAPAAANVLAALLAGRDPEPFRYRRKGEVLGLGRLGAVVEAFGFKFVGLPAWLVSRAVHLARLPDWGDRVAVAWAWAKDLVKG